VRTTTAIRVDVEGAVGRLTLARPEKLNALSRAALEELAEAAQWFDDERGVKVVVVSGEGRAFSSGFDLGDRSWAEVVPPEQSAAVGRAMAEALGGMRAITIAEIRGHCIGGGIVLAAACDLRVASVTATFRIPEVDLGVPLFWTGVPRLVRELGPALTKELVLTGRVFDAEEARAIRFVNRVVADDRLEGETDALAATLASKPAIVLASTKAQVEQAAPSVPRRDGGVEADLDAFRSALHDPEARATARQYTSSRAPRPPAR
jgi:enoyl-CoA hydratase/carnithine racemase